MELLLGGAYQGKRDYARTRLGAQRVFTCTEDSCAIDFSADCIDALEEFCLACVREGKDPVEVFAQARERWENSVLICRDIFCGVVPLGAQMRQWRLDTGRLCAYLSSQATHVTRLFCGLPQVLK